MSSQTENEQDANEAKIQQNITNWQASNDPLAPLTDQQLDIVYEISDLVKDLYAGSDEKPKNESKPSDSLINSNRSYIKWLISIEDEIKYEDFAKYQNYNDVLAQHKSNCQNLYDCVSLITLSIPNTAKKRPVFSRQQQLTPYKTSRQNTRTSHQRRTIYTI